MNQGIPFASVGWFPYFQVSWPLVLVLVELIDRENCVAGTLFFFVLRAEISDNVFILHIQLWFIWAQNPKLKIIFLQHFEGNASLSSFPAFAVKQPNAMILICHHSCMDFLFSPIFLPDTKF